MNQTFFPAQFILLNLFFLFFLVVTSLFGGHALGIASYCFYFSLLILCFKRFRKGKFDFNFWMGWIVVAHYAAMVTLWFSNIWFAPSNDDSINHLGFLQAILNSGSVLLGKIERPGADWFGSSAYHFYPTGAHALIALWMKPFSVSMVSFAKAALMLVISLFPGFLWWGSVRAFPSLPWMLRLFFVAVASTLPVFPINALGEGGVSRIFGLIFFVPLWLEFAKFEYVRRHFRFRTGFYWTLFLAPVLLFIHPSLFPLIGVLVLFFPRRAFVGACFGGILGGALFYWIYHTGEQEVLKPEFVQNLVAQVRMESWFERLKGPFHYWFSDPAGFGKFLSPKNFFVYAALFLSLAGMISRKNLILFLMPFLMASLALIHSPIAEQIGLIFYHSAKRIAELTPILGFTLACVAAEWLVANVKQWLRYRFQLGGLLFILATTFFTVFYPYSQKSLDHFNTLYATPMSNQMVELKQALNSISPKARVLIDRHDFDSLRFVGAFQGYTRAPECAEVSTVSDYCKARLELASGIRNKTVQLHGEIWWLPKPEDDTLVLADAKSKGLPVIELTPSAHLIRLQGD